VRSRILNRSAEFRPYPTLQHGRLAAANALAVHAGVPVPFVGITQPAHGITAQHFIGGFLNLPPTMQPQAFQQFRAACNKLSAFTKQLLGALQKDSCDAAVLGELAVQTQAAIKEVRCSVCSAAVKFVECRCYMVVASHVPTQRPAVQVTEAVPASTSLPTETIKAAQDAVSAVLSRVRRFDFLIGICLYMAEWG
jgi:hypothetical protein